MVSHKSWPDLAVLTALGFSPDSALMNDPKLFVDRRFLGALMIQLEHELGPDETCDALFQIGLLHGLRDADRVLRGEFLPSLNDAAPLSVSTAAASTPLAMRLGAHHCDHQAGGITIAGSWPECYEADARLSRLAPVETPHCALSAGYTSGWLSGTLEANVLVREIRCLAAGDAHCEFVAREVDGWGLVADPPMQALADVIDFQRFREVAQSDAGPLPAFHEIDSVLDLDGDESVVHVWGPVMVMPFVGVEEALGAVDILSRDPGTSEVGVVVVDLRHAVLDEAFGADALEQVVSVIDSWGAEAILAGVSPLCEAAVAGVEARHLLIRKDLPEAIAVAFQIAEAQGRPQ